MDDMEMKSAIHHVVQQPFSISDSGSIDVAFDESNIIPNEQQCLTTTSSKPIDNMHPKEELYPKEEPHLYHEQHRDRSMYVILPPTSVDKCGNVDLSNAKVIHTMEVLDEILSSSSTRQILDELLTPVPVLLKKQQNQQQNKKKNGKGKKDVQDQKQNRPAILNEIEASKSIRFIQAGRYEIFVQARDKETHVFDWLCEQVFYTVRKRDYTATRLSYETPIEMKRALLQFAIEQAKQDERIRVSTSKRSEIVYDNFSLIVSYDPVGAQPQHIDLLYPNFQYGLIITDQSPGTTVYRAPHKIRTVKDIQNFVWKDLPSTMYVEMERDSIVTSLIAQFGDVLCPDIVPIKYWEPNEDSNEDALFRTGTLLSLPGSEIHAGPRCSKYRTVLFFSACPDVTNTIPYHPDTQYFAPLLCCDLISLLWNTLNLSDRMYMLNRLLDSIKEANCQHLERHISDMNLIRFLNVAMNWDKKKPKSKNYLKKYGNNTTVMDFVHHFASRGICIDTQDIGIKIINNTKSSSIKIDSRNFDVPTNFINLTETLKTMDKVSSDDLVVGFEGKYFPAHVFAHRPTSSSSSAAFKAATRTSLPSLFDNQSNELADQTASSSHGRLNVLLFYPEDQSCEGNVIPYTLQWNQEERHHYLFNGLNGILRDNEGNMIPCSNNSLVVVTADIAVKGPTPNGNTSFSCSDHLSVVTADIAMKGLTPNGNTSFSCSDHPSVAKADIAMKEPTPNRNTIFSCSDHPLVTTADIAMKEPTPNGNTFSSCSDHPLVMTADIAMKKPKRKRKRQKSIIPYSVRPQKRGNRVTKKFIDPLNMVKKSCLELEPKNLVSANVASHYIEKWTDNGDCFSESVESVSVI
jgi:hypothetical protein